MSEIRVNKVVNSTGDNDSGLDMTTNDQVLIKTANTTAVTINASQAVAIAGNATVAGTLGVTGLTTLGNNLVVPNNGYIGSASDTDAMRIASNGVVTFSQTPVGAGGGSLVKLSAVTTTGATSVDFNSSLITDSYMTYRIIGSNVRGITANQTPELLLSVDNGSSLNLNVRGAKFQNRLYADQGFNQVYFGASGSVHQMGNNISATASILCTFDVTVYNTRSTSGIKYVNSTFTGSINGDGDAYRWTTPSRVDVTSTAINFLRCKFSSGNIAGTFTLYGIVE